MIPLPIIMNGKDNSVQYKTQEKYVIAKTCSKLIVFKYLYTYKSK